MRIRPLPATRPAPPAPSIGEKKPRLWELEKTARATALKSNKAWSRYLLARALAESAVKAVNEETARLIAKRRGRRQ